MRLGQSIAVLVACVAVSVSCGPVAQPGSEDAQLNTNIAVLSSADSLHDLVGNAKQGLTVVDPRQLLNGAPETEANDIVEDPNDPFITSRSGKPRPNFVSSSDEWAEAPISKQQTPLHRVKRCGGGGGGGDDGDANRARRARRNRARRARRARRAQARAARRAAKASEGSTTTTVTRKVIQDGQVVSQSVIPQGTVVQHQPVVQAVAPQQPVVVQHQPAQPQVVVGQPQVVSGQPQVAAVQPQLAAPSISVQGSVKVN